LRVLGLKVEGLGLCCVGCGVEGAGYKRFRGGLVFKAHILCVCLNSRLESNKEEEDTSAGDEEAHDARGVRQRQRDHQWRGHLPSIVISAYLITMAEIGSVRAAIEIR